MPASATGHTHAPQLFPSSEHDSVPELTTVHGHCRNVPGWHAAPPVVAVPELPHPRPNVPPRPAPTTTRASACMCFIIEVVSKRRSFARDA